MSNVLYKLSSFLKNGHSLLNLFEHKDISKRKALKIQRDTFDLRKKCDTDEKHVPYLDIIEFLNSPHDEIFFSAVTNLVNIAINEKSVRADIKSILENKIADSSISEAHRQYIANKIENI